MEAVKEALLDDFNAWLNEDEKPLGSRQEQLDIFMKEKYATRVAEGNIFDHIKAMNTPSSPSGQESAGSSSASGVLHNLAACAAESDKEESSTQRKEPKRRKRSSTGISFIDKFPCPHGSSPNAGYHAAGIWENKNFNLFIQSLPQRLCHMTGSTRKTATFLKGHFWLDIQKMEILFISSRALSVKQKQLGS